MKHLNFKCQKLLIIFKIHLLNDKTNYLNAILFIATQHVDLSKQIDIIYRPILIGRKQKKYTPYQYKKKWRKIVSTDCNWVKNSIVIGMIR